MTSRRATEAVGERVALLCNGQADSASVDGGSVALVSSEGSRMVLSATDDVAAGLEETQMTLGEGPGVDAVQALSPVLVADLFATALPDSARWPFFARHARTLDVRALFAFPIRVSEVSVGTLGLYRHEAGALSTPQLGAAMSAVNDIARTLLDDATWNEPDGNGRTGRTRGGELSTAQVHQAAGMVMVQLDIAIDEAMAMLRATAFAESVTLTDLASDVVDRRRRLRRGAPE